MTGEMDLSWNDCRFPCRYLNRFGSDACGETSNTAVQQDVMCKQQARRFFYLNLRASGHQHNKH